MNYDVIVIGGGSAGLMASIAASKQGAKVLLLDKGEKLGRKLGISGGGRCNVTNNKEDDELIKHIPGNGRFLYSSFSNFNNKDIIAFFENLGIKLKEEDNGRMFPVTDRAKTVVDTLVGQIRKQGVEIKLNSPVDTIIYEDNRVAGVRLRSGEAIDGNAVIVASGGKSVPQTGSTGDGYPWAVKAGHTITELFPTEVPLTSNEPFITSKELQGLSLRDVSLSVWNPKGKKIIEHHGDMLFTHFGVSGPIALRCSQFVVKALKQFQVGNIEVSVDLMPDNSVDEVYSLTMRLTELEPRKSIKNILKACLPEKMIPLLLQQAGLAESLTYDNLPRQDWMQLAKLIKRFPIRVYGTLSIEDAFVTGGGIHLKEIDPRTMESKLVSGLYFCGEILDIHGYTGGYNITAAFSTGYSAGMNAAIR
ncbi:BaiN/RdsA family NAD(P)/FAD-dependent oxidoreductase [Cohnella herbarum]|uniref:NAD(P)/FAD-dependent oxidoreductase n=1 Tax=Cohnella herbarum TaxID=2728023 RepID=A0A7Z2VKP1_9BACL|nr:NAD(P)/FAD-dependent oxidoreductase [Cohnella herbarum]QJD84822.1 NAD(P)/FAD-dependent oxidoreductase [Cohnella herbarum]